ncbi:MAG TPA: bifunctional phosphoribosylaminoimidazolecarboxamide formyltransferase/IMP cyclohydrolase [Candidatus Limnocylindrales bacterium]|nr:bifunctional phosphoribosylaminoimidazolecarboxamide formyltransferase/IMP cyclohydrolase [Candidatus Limnocylindrales bacterium]
MISNKTTNKSYALISVFDKKGIVEIAKIFTQKGIQIISTGGTAKHLTENGIKVIPIEKITNTPESFDGRVKTVSFQITSGLLFDRDNKSHIKQAVDLNTPIIDYVISNFYNFADNPGIEMIDIGGPTIVRSAAKNFKSVTVLVDPNDYGIVSDQVLKNSHTTEELRKKLAVKAFSYVARYDCIIANYFQRDTDGADRFVSLQNGRHLRYGENPHQKASFFKEDKNKDKLGLGNYKTLQGKETSFNNYLDLDAGLQAISLIGQDKPACVILKHTNPCGAATAATIEEAFKKAWFDGDPLAAFGGVLIFNRPITEKLAEQMVADKKFFEIIVAPEITKGALEVFSKRPKLQLLENKYLSKPYLSKYKDVKRIRGGFLVQDFDTYELTKKDLVCVTKKKPTKEQINDLLFAWKISQVSKSNCVVAVKNNVLVASGVGQQDRKRCCELCVKKAVKPLTGAVAATDGFFPFSDGPDILIKAGIKAIIQPGGSIRDQDTIDACNKSRVAMLMTGVRAFKH